MKPVVKLIDYTKNAFNLSIATARTCYSGSGLIYPEDMEKSDKSIELRDKIAKSTKKAGHLTTRQHPQFIFTLDKVSRHFVWSFLHSHPYYNSEQVSQRYVEVKADNFYIPPDLTPVLNELYLKTIKFATDEYQRFIELVKPAVTSEYFSIYKTRANYPEKWELPIKKRCLEVARYLLPLGTHTFLYHTINGLTLHRYHRLVNSFDTPHEQKIVIEQMIAEARKIDPLFVEEMDDPVLLEDTPEYKIFTEHFQSNKITEEFAAEFDENMQGKYSRLVSWSEKSVAVFCDSVRSVLGLPKSHLSDDEAIELVLNPAKNKHLGSTLNETTLSKISRSMFNIHYTFKKKISHTADSQDQRHRMVPASRPVLQTHFSGKADFIVPGIMNKYPDLLTEYNKFMHNLFSMINDFVAAGGSREFAAYLLPNAFPVRFYESGDLLNLHHKYKSRTCFNAQEEIFHASVQEIRDISAVHPQIGKWLRSPCWLRFMADEKPVCPEGNKYCGVQVWKKGLEEYDRII